MKQGRWRVTLRSNDRFVAVKVRGDFGSRVPFSLNRPDRVTLLDSRRRCRIGAKQWPVFVAEDGGAPPLLDRADIARGIVGLGLAKNESLHVYESGLVVYIQPTSLKRVVEVVGAAAALADLMPSTAAPPLDLSDLPVRFRALAPLIKTWGETDDAAREKRLARASRARLAELVAKVAPHFRSINTYLDRFRGKAMPESAAALGALAECATEAQLDLTRRTARAVPGKRVKRGPG